MTIEQTLRQGLDKMVQDIIAASRAAGQQASGQTYANIHVEVSGHEGVVYAPSYLYTLAVGRGSGKVPYNFPDILLEWAKNKDISFDSPVAARRWANAVAWKIRRDGSLLFRERQTIDILDTPIAAFEVWLDKQLGVLFTAEIEDTFIPLYRK